MHIFHQYGARHTGTNYVQAILEENFSDVMILHNIMWKHGEIPSPEQLAHSFIRGHKKHILKTCAGRVDLYEILCTNVAANNIHSLLSMKDPYAWIDSMWRYTRNIFFCDAPEAKTPYIFFDPKIQLSQQTENVIKSIEVYNKRYKDWCSKSRLIVRYEDLLLDHSMMLDWFKEAFNLTPIYDEYKDIKTGCDPIPIGLKYVSPNWDYKDYYLNNKYLNALPPRIINTITQTVDWNLFSQYGYAPI